MLKLGVPTFEPGATWAVTETCLLAALMLHTQITKVAVLPGVTCDVDSDCAHTHSCGVFPGETECVGVGLGWAL